MLSLMVQYNIQNLQTTHHNIMTRHNALPSCAPAAPAPWRVLAALAEFAGRIADACGRRGALERRARRRGRRNAARHAGAVHSTTRHGGAARPGCSWHSDSTTLLLQQFNVFIFVELVEAPLIPKKVINVATDCCY